MSEKKEEGKALVKLYKPNGKEMAVNSDSLEHALKIGWSKTKPKK